MQASALALSLLVLNMASSSGLFQSHVLDIHDRWEHFHLPEDILRSYGEMHRTFYRLRGGKLSREQEQGQHKMWATTACESFLFELYFNTCQLPESHAEESLGHIFALSNERCHLFVELLGHAGDACSSRLFLSVA